MTVMTDRAFELRAREWLEGGPTTAPGETVSAILSALDTAPQRSTSALPGRVVDGLTRRDPLDVGLDGLRPRRARSLTYVALAAALAALVIGALLLAGRVPDLPEPPPVDLLGGYPLATLRLEASRGDLPRPISGDMTVVSVQIGRLDIETSFVVAAQCVGPAESAVIDAFVDDGATPANVLTTLTIPCDGSVASTEYVVGAGMEPGSDVVFTFSGPAGASWRGAVGVYPQSLKEPPGFGPIEGTAGWTMIYDLRPGLPALKAQGNGIRVQVPEGATALGIIVECQLVANVWIEIKDAGTSTIVAGGQDADVSCPTADPVRIELSVPAGTKVVVWAQTDAPVWSRMFIETDASIEITYPEAPAMPADVAATAYSATVGGVVTFGTIGSNQQQGLPLPDGSSGWVSGDLIPTTSRDPISGDSDFQLISVSEGRIIGTVVEASEPITIWNAWVLTPHERTIWLVEHASPRRFEFFLSDLEGRDPRSVAKIPSAFWNLGYGQAPDDSAIVVQWCADDGCHRLVVDGPTGEATVIKQPDAKACELLGVIDGLVVEAVSDACGFEATTPVRITVAPITGGERRVVHDGAVMGQVVRTAGGPKLVHADASLTADIIWQVLDLTTGHSDLLLDADASMAGGPQPVQLPPGWVLFAISLGDSPAFGSINQRPPLLVNIDTGERIELVNLPHRRG